ncbi:polysaccharide deacetylase family protein [Longitalea arenae]|uniref:polysaccharide deacetylase family protein n=1 Tax=Longitalea arenae TaxID=2812558 RepID=UPI001968A2AB|nr:polysaccharide deacetylase family protein [Longitalea arenae]
MQSIFTISLDFELHWGVLDKRDRLAREACYKNTLRAVPQMLELFAKYDAHVTWATVGSLFAGDQEEWETLAPSIEPDYVQENYSAYKWVRQHGMPSQYKWAHFAPEEVAMIMEYPGQELATHTFSHYYCLEQQREKMAFDADLKAAVAAARKFNASMRSLVFPRNQFNPDYLKVCYDNGIKTVRTNPSGWFWSPVTDGGAGLLRRAFRTADAYMQVGGIRTSYPLSDIKVIAGEPLQLPASRFLRPWSPNSELANKMRLRRSCQEIRIAAQRKEVYHLWWHPENFGDHPEQNLKSLEVLLQEYRRCKEKYGMTSWNMGEYDTYLRGSKEEKVVKQNAMVLQ